MTQDYLDIDDAISGAVLRREHLAEVCRLEDGAIVIDVQRLMSDKYPDVSFGSNYYAIELSRCKDYGQIVSWAHHLCGKNWMSLPLLRRFMDVAMDANHLTLPHA